LLRFNGAGRGGVGVGVNIAPKTLRPKNITP